MATESEPGEPERGAWRDQLLGCGCLLVMVAVVWGSISWIGIKSPASAVLAWLVPHGGLFWLIASTVVAGFDTVAPFPLLLASTMAFDSWQGELPRRTNLVALFWVAPATGLTTIVGAWACYLLNLERIANYLALGPWVAGLTLIATTAIVMSAALSKSRS